MHILFLWRTRIQIVNKKNNGYLVVGGMTGERYTGELQVISNILFCYLSREHMHFILLLQMFDILFYVNKPSDTQTHMHAHKNLTQDR